MLQRQWFIKTPQLISLKLNRSVSLIGRWKNDCLRHHVRKSSSFSTSVVAGKNAVISSVEQEVGDKLRRKFDVNDEMLLPVKAAANDRSYWSLATAALAKGHMSEYAIQYFYPSGYPNSVGASYSTFVKYSLVANVSSTVCFVFSTQSLLMAMGLSSGAIPVAAALNWILKDGLGQLGGIVFASTINHRFDIDPKRWRLVAAFLLDISMWVEAITPLFPNFFLLFASVANMGKNVGWLSASATRAGIHQAYVRHHNLADITAKAGSQSIAASVIGTAIGCLASPVVGTDVTNVFAAVVVLSSIHLFSTYKAISQVELNSLNMQRLWLAVRPVIRSVNDDTSRKPDLAAVLKPCQVSRLERIIHWGKYDNFQGRVSLECDDGVPLRVHVGAPVIELRDFLQVYRESEQHEEQYLIQFADNCIQLVYKLDATKVDVLRGVLHAFLASEALKRREVATPEARQQALQQARLSLRRHHLTEELIHAMRQHGWNTKMFFIEQQRRRVQLS